MRLKTKGVGSLPILRCLRESCSPRELACLTFHFPLESALSVVSKRKVEINTMAHKLRQIEILRKIDPPYVGCGTRWKFIPLALTFNTVSRALARLHRRAYVYDVIFLFYWTSLRRYTWYTLLHVSLVTTNSARSILVPARPFSRQICINVRAKFQHKKDTIL